MSKLWLPPLFQKQRQVVLSKSRRILASGPRLSGKTIAVEHRVFRHLWNVNGARVAIIPLTNRTGTLGVWPELVGPVFHIWHDAGVSSDLADFGYSTTPRQDNQTRTRFFRLHNKHGTTSECVLFPIESAEEAYAKLLSTQFSMIWISEAHLFDDRKIFDVALGQLRLYGVPFHETSIICDCNPPDDGEDHWLHEVFVSDPEMPEEEFPDDWPLATREAFKAQQAETKAFRFALDENTFLDPGQKAQLIATYATNKLLYQRFVLGLWVKGQPADGIFKQVFSTELHVAGNADPKDPADWEVLLPVTGPAAHRAPSGKLLMLAGWDLGDVNHAWSAIQPRLQAGKVTAYDQLDEHVVIGGNVSIEDFTREVLRKRAAIEAEAGEPVEWLDYSDSSASDFRAAVRRGQAAADEGATDAAIVEQVSGGAIRMISAGPVKRAGWQRRRANYLTRLLAAGLYRVSAQCRHAVAMLSNIRASTAAKASTYLAPGQVEKHSFDSVTYPLSMFNLAELNERDDAAPRQRTRLSV